MLWLGRTADVRSVQVAGAAPPRTGIARHDPIAGTAMLKPDSAPLSSMRLVGAVS
jgi:hypothetical protein